ncbi:MAG: hypothetical protein QM617_09680 [Comamonas sp.]
MAHILFTGGIGLRLVAWIGLLAVFGGVTASAHAATEYTGEVQVDRLAWGRQVSVTANNNFWKPDYPPLPASDGYLYGIRNMTKANGSDYAAWRMPADGGTVSKIISYSDGGSVAGQGWFSESSAGEIYGVRSTSSTDNTNGQTAFFKLDSSYEPVNVASTILSYTTSGGVRTCLPQLLPDSAGNLYGVCQYDYTESTTNAGPVVFKLDSSGNYSVVAHLPIRTYYLTLAYCLAGTVSTTNASAFGTPISMVLKDDYLYLLKTYAERSCDTGSLVTTTGVALHKIAVDGSSSTVLHEFDTDSALPTTTYDSGMVIANDGYLYGIAGSTATTTTTAAVQGSYTLTIDGTASADPGFIWRISTSGTDYAVMHTFDWTNGAGPYGALALGGDGRIYGVTTVGGSNTRDDTYICPEDYSSSSSISNSKWTAYVCDSDGSTDGVLYSFDPSLVDSGTPYAVQHEFSRYTTGKSARGLRVDTDGSKLYGAALKGGTFLETDYTVYTQDSETGAWSSTSGTKMAYQDYGSVFAVTLIEADAAVIDSFTSSADSVTQGDSFTLSWSTTNAESCTASGDWSGSVDTSGSVELSPTDVTTHNYTLTCSGEDGTSDAVKTVSVTVTAPANAVVSSASYGNGGGGAASTGLLAALAGLGLLAWRRRAGGANPSPARGEGSAVRPAAGGW